MAVVTSDFLAGVLTTFRARFQDVFDSAANLTPWRDVLAMQVDSNTDTETHAWMGTPPAMQDVTQRDLIMEGLYAFNYTLPNLTYKAAIEVKRSTFEDDKLNLIRPRIDQLALEAARHPGQLVLQAAATNGLAFDGVAFFADTRVIGRSANIDNSIAGTGTTVAALQTDLASARAQMMLFQDDQGRPMGARPNVIMVPPALEQAMWQALNANQGSILNPVVPGSATSLATAQGFQLIVNPYLTDVNDWFVFHVDGVFKPFIFQTRISPTLESVLDNTEQAVVRDRYIYSVRARYNVGYGDPRYAVRITN